VVECIQESPAICTLQWRFTDSAQQVACLYSPGQFNMLTTHGVGEEPRSVASHPDDEQLFDHAFRGRPSHPGFGGTILSVYTAVPVASVPNAASFGPFFA
jgi:hypothetical protein